MTPIPPESSKILEIYLLIAQYPILASRIRRRMREELFRRGIINPERFEQEVREKAILSQKREGLYDLERPESTEQWELRYHRVRRMLTDFYFAYNLPVELLHQIIDSVVGRTDGEEGERLSSDLALRFNPELAPLEMVLRQAEVYESLPAEQRASVDHHLQELRVVLLKSLISDQLAFIRIAKHWFSVADFHYVLDHRIGTGKIGGKAAGMLLGYKILMSLAPELADRIVIPRSYFIGADVFYEFLALNDLDFINNQKYKPLDQIRRDYPEIQERFTCARFPEEIAEQLRELLREIGNVPVIVRSSSLLEDNFGASFAGKYLSVFCPNQGSLSENLRDLTLAIRRSYASVFNPNVMMYRRRMGLLDYDERMAILLQEVQGERYRQNYFPAVSGVAYSYSPIPWNVRLKREEGLVRMVVGLGTRAVERTGNDYPRLVHLSHPQLRPEGTRKAIRHYSQRYIDLLDLEQNRQVSLPVSEVLDGGYRYLPWLASVDDGENIRPILYIGPGQSPAALVVTLDGLLGRTDFVPLLKTVLRRLSEVYEQPIDIEFALSFDLGEEGKPRPILHLLQCRPHQQWDDQGKPQVVLARLEEAERLFIGTKLMPQGRVSNVEYVVYVDPERYHCLSVPGAQGEIAQAIGLLNKVLERYLFVLIGPGRWGSSDSQLGVPVTYADIFNSRALIEIALPERGYASDPSYGTHFFQDLIESQIYPLAIFPDHGTDWLNWAFLQEATNRLREFLPQAPEYVQECVRVIHVPSERAGQVLEIVMDGEKGIGFFRPPVQESD